MASSIFLETLHNTPNVSIACVKALESVLEDKKISQLAEFFSGKVKEGLDLLLPVIIKDLVIASDKRKGISDLVYQPPLHNMGSPDACGYLPGFQFCTIDAVPTFGRWGLCVPVQCDFGDIMTAVFPPVTHKLAEHVKGACGPLKASRTLAVAPLDTGAIITLVFLIGLTLVVIGSTFILRRKPKKSRSSTSSPPPPPPPPATANGSEASGTCSRREMLMDCFSLSANYARLTSAVPSDTFLCLNGVRSVSILMIIYGHTLFFLLFVVGITNPREVMGFAPKGGFLATPVGLISNNMLYGVDSFLCLAGFLGAHLFMRELQRRQIQGFLPFLKITLSSYLQRYLRLTPAYAVLLVCFIFLAPLMSSSPASATDLEHEVQRCRQKWWENIVYVNNILSTPHNSCYMPSWFLAVVQQLFLLVPWISMLELKRKHAGSALALLLCVASYIYTFLRGQAEGWRINFIDRPGFPLFLDHFYTNPLMRMPTFLLGVISAFLYRHYGEALKERLGSTISSSYPAAVMGVSLGLLAVAVFANYEEVAYSPGRWSNTGSALFLTFSFSLWTLGLVLLCGLMILGEGGIIKQMMEIPFWNIFSRLTYSMYLVHPMVILSVIASRDGAPFHFSLLNIFNEFLGFATLSTFTAVIFYFLVEAPFTQLERLLFKSTKTQKDKISEWPSTPKLENSSNDCSVDIIFVDGSAIRIPSFSSETQ